TLRRPSYPQRLAAISGQADIDVALDGPRLEGAEDLLPPDAPRDLAAEDLVQLARHAADQRPIGSEAERQMLRIEPGNPQDRGAKARLQSFQFQFSGHCRELTLYVQGNSQP